MRTTLSTLWTFLTTLLGAANKGAQGLDALADYAKESAEELRDEARTERRARLERLANSGVVAEQ